MAEAAVNFAIEILGPLLVEEIRLLGGVRKEVQSIKSELESLRSFLKDADARAAVEELEGGGEESVRTWMKQLRDEAYRIEDVVDEHTLSVAKLPHGSGLIGVLRRINRFIKKLKLRRGVANEIQDIKSVLADIKRRGESYRFRSIDERSSSGTRNVIPHDSRVGSYFVEDDEVVGIESTRDKLIDWLVNGRSERSVVAVVGEGGLGKTTLAGKLFNNDAVKIHFDCRAWVTVGKEYNKKDLLRTMIREFYHINQESVQGGIDKMEEKDLITTLREHLKDKTYMVVFDDVWKIDFWGHVEHALLDKKKSSRILLTTRRMTVAVFCRSSSFIQVHELETLPTNEAWKLFCRKAFGPNFEGGYCPSELKELSQEILAKCGGLPLAIVAVGGLLSTKQKVVSEWQKLLDGLGSKLGRDPHLKDCNRVLSEGYYDLPHHLKSCLLYIGLFPGSCEINCARLMRLWIAEGFVQYSIAPTVEQVADEYLNELIDRSLVQVSERDISGRVRICLVHDLMYEIIVRKAKELGFGHALIEENLSHCSNTRRISIHKNTDGVSESIKDWKVRSVVLFNMDNLPVAFMNAILVNFKLMKVLDLEDAAIDYLPKEVGNLFHLHYLSVKNTEVKIIPKSIGKLLNLETLDMKHSLVSELPIEIRNLKKLRYLLVYNIEDRDDLNIRGAVMQEGIGTLIDLQKLSFVQANAGVLKELRKLRQLRKLGIRVTSGNGRDLCTLIANVENLESLTVASTSREEILDLQYLITPPPYLQRLYLMGNMQKLPDWILKLKNLIRIGLDLSGLTADPLEVLHALPNLLELRLFLGGYNFQRLHFKEGWLPKLRKLVLLQFKAMKSVMIEKGAMPNLRTLAIESCPLLTEIPAGIEHLRTLKFLQFSDMLTQVYCMTKDENWEKVTKHIPEIYVICGKTGESFTAEYLSSMSPDDLMQLAKELD